MSLAPSITKPPPADIALEQQIIQTLLHNPAQIELVVPLLSSGLIFFKQDNTILLTALIAVYQSGQQVRPINIARWLDRNPPEASTGTYLDALKKLLVDIYEGGYGLPLMDLENHCLHCRELWVRRGVIGNAQSAIVAAYNPSIDLSGLRDAVVHIGDELTKGITLATVDPFSAQVDSYLDWFCSPMPAGGLSGVPTGSRNLDRLTGGWQNSDMILIAARPGMGKTLVGNDCAKSAAEAGVPTAMVSFEMPVARLMDRWIASETGIEYGRLEKRRDTLTTEEANLVHEAASRLATLPLYVYPHEGSRDIADVCAWIRDMVRRYGVRFVEIDYVQQLENRAMKGFAQTSEPVQATNSSEIKKLQHQLQIPIMCMAQLNRESENSEDHRPKKSQLRSSGQYEQDASLVILLYREDYFEAEADAKAQSKLHGGWVEPDLTHKIEYIIDKNRSGPPVIMHAFLDVRTGQRSDHHLSMWNWRASNADYKKGMHVEAKELPPETTKVYIIKKGDEPF